MADHLAHQPIEDYQSVQYDFPDEEILYLKMKDCDKLTLDEGPKPGSRWGMVFDGAVNQYGNGIGAVIVNPQGTHFPFTARLTFKCTNNMVEYEACIMGLKRTLISESSILRSMEIQLWWRIKSKVNGRRINPV